jgi:chitin deacetylase
MNLIVQNVLKPKYLIRQRRILLAGFAAVCSLLIDLLIPIKASTQQEAVLPSVTQPWQPQITFSVAQKFQGKIIRQVSLRKETKAIALTFDDGPNPTTTPQVLSILKENNIKATFFLIGGNLKKFPEIGRRVVADGHAIGNHTWHHWRRLMDEFTAAREIDDTSAFIYKTLGVKTSLFRPPNGFLYNGLADYARKEKELVVLWSVDSGDWRGSHASVEGLVNKVVNAAKPGAIVLMHDGGGDRSRTVLALPKIIQELKERGYTFVSVPELLQMQDQERTTTVNASVKSER